MGASPLYSWDEVGRLVRARRWDQATLPADPTSVSPVVDLQYHYAAGDSRVLKTARSGNQEVHTAYIFPSLELRRAEFDTDAPGDYTLDSSTEVAYLFANGVRLARLVHQPLDSAGDGKLLRVFFELGDHLGSTSVALDKDTGELVERSTYQAYGGAESSYRPSKWGDFREDYRFTGKEEDVEVGLTYFGKRFYNALLQRWVSADPLEVHEAASGEPNLYSCVGSSPLENVDPIGLEAANAQQKDREADIKDKGFFNHSGSYKNQTPKRASPKAATTGGDAGQTEGQGDGAGKEKTIAQKIAEAGGVAQGEEKADDKENGSENGMVGGNCPAGNPRCLDNPGVQTAVGLVQIGEAIWSVATGVAGAAKAAWKWASKGGIKAAWDAAVDSVSKWFTKSADDDAAKAAEAARDAAGEALGRKHATYAGGYKDGNVVAGCSRNPAGCAEDDIARQLGPDANMTGAKGWRRNKDTGELEWTDIPVCKNCQQKYTPSQFPEGTKADPGGAWKR